MMPITPQNVALGNWVSRMEETRPIESWISRMTIALTVYASTEWFSCYPKHSSNFDGRTA